MAKTKQKEVGDRAAIRWKPKDKTRMKLLMEKWEDDITGVIRRSLRLAAVAEGMEKQ